MTEIDRNNKTDENGTSTYYALATTRQSNDINFKACVKIGSKERAEAAVLFAKNLLCELNDYAISNEDWRIESTYDYNNCNFRLDYMNVPRWTKDLVGYFWSKQQKDDNYFSDYEFLTVGVDDFRTGKFKDVHTGKLKFCRFLTQKKTGRHPEDDDISTFFIRLVLCYLRALRTQPPIVVDENLQYSNPTFFRFLESEIWRTLCFCYLHDNQCNCEGNFARVDEIDDSIAIFLNNNNDDNVSLANDDKNNTTPLISQYTQPITTPSTNITMYAATGHKNKTQAVVDNGGDDFTTEEILPSDEKLNVLIDISEPCKQYLQDLLKVFINKSFADGFESYHEYKAMLTNQDTNQIIWFFLFVVKMSKSEIKKMVENLIDLSGNMDQPTRRKVMNTFEHKIDSVAKKGNQINCNRPRQN